MYTPTKKLAYSAALGAFFISLFYCALPSFAAPQTSSGAVQIDSLVAGPPPATPPTIELPAPETTFSDKSITVSGSCISGLVVKLYRNNFFAGSTLCQNNGKFSLSIDLYMGRNDLIARQYDIANQASPDSNAVVVFYTPSTSPALPSEPATQPSTPQTTQPPGDTATGTAQFQLVIEYDYTLQAILVNKPFHLPVSFAGGTPPYAININWGDGTNDIFSKDTTDTFTTEHTYTKTGYYTATISVSDKNGNKASMQFVILVSGADSVNGSSDNNNDATDQNAQWQQVMQIGIFAISIAGSFLLGRFSYRSVRS